MVATFSWSTTSRCSPRSTTFGCKLCRLVNKVDSTLNTNSTKESISAACRLRMVFVKNLKHQSISLHSFFLISNPLEKKKKKLKLIKKLNQRRKPRVSYVSISVKRSKTFGCNGFSKVYRVSIGRFVCNIQSTTQGLK